MPVAPTTSVDTIPLPLRSGWANKFKVPIWSLVSGEETQRPGITLYISLLGNNQGWLFQWPSTGDPYYRIVLQGQQIATVQDTTDGMQSYVYNGTGFPTYPPPLEIMPSSCGLAPSEINQPFLSLQWYGNPLVSFYQVQETIGGNQQLWFQIQEVGSTVYTWQTPILQDGTTHLYSVIPYNSLGQAGTGLAFNVTPVVTPPLFVDTAYEVTYDNSGNNLVLNTA